MLPPANGYQRTIDSPHRLARPILAKFSTKILVLIYLPNQMNQVYGE